MVGLSHRQDVKGNDLNLPELKRMELACAGDRTDAVAVDEVMAGLNPSDCQGVDLILRIRDQGMSIVLIEHVMKAVMLLSDRLYVQSGPADLAGFHRGSHERSGRYFIVFGEKVLEIR